MFGSQRALPFSLFVAFTVAMSYEFLHLLEHGFIVYQHLWLGISRLGAHGVLFFFDLEWTHFLFNLMFLAVLGSVFIFLQLYRRAGRMALGWIGRLFLLGVALEAFHVFEHIVRITQHVQTNCEPCTGFLLQFVHIDDIVVHSGFNFFAFSFTIPLYFFLLKIRRET